MVDAVGSRSLALNYGIRALSETRSDFVTTDTPPRVSALPPHITQCSPPPRRSAIPPAPYAESPPSHPSARSESATAPRLRCRQKSPPAQKASPHPTACPCATMSQSTALHAPATSSR